MLTILKRSVILLLVMTLLCGAGYTFLLTGAAQLLFPYQANGSVITVDGKEYGSELLAQRFEDDGHLWGRVMVLDTQTFADEEGRPLLYAGPSNMSPAGDAFEAAVAERVAKLRAAHPEETRAVPVDLVTCSGSGLDPHISPAAAEYQLSRLEKSTGRTQEELEAIILENTQGRFLGIIGEPRVNVLKVNLTLDGIL